MIKPGTLCMIRGVPPNVAGSDCNGQIVTVEGVKFDDVYLISPELTTDYSHHSKLNGCPEKYLYPFQDPDTLLTSALDKILETV